MKHKVGDKVRVRKDLIVGEVYGKYKFVNSMKPYMGKSMIIISVDNHAYYFKEDKNKWCWTDEMLESEEGINILVNGNKVVAKRGDKVGIARCLPKDEFDIFTGARLAIDRLEEKCKPYAWLKEGMIYYYPYVSNTDLYTSCEYVNDEYDKKMISRGLVFRTKEEAIKVAKKMLEVVK